MSMHIPILLTLLVLAVSPLAMAQDEQMCEQRIVKATALVHIEGYVWVLETNLARQLGAGEDVANAPQLVNARENLVSAVADARSEIFGAIADPRLEAATILRFMQSSVAEYTTSHDNTPLLLDTELYTAYSLQALAENKFLKLEDMYSESDAASIRQGFIGVDSTYDVRQDPAMASAYLDDMAQSIANINADTQSPDACNYFRDI